MSTLQPIYHLHDSISKCDMPVSVGKALFHISILLRFLAQLPINVSRLPPGRFSDKMQEKRPG